MDNNETESSQTDLTSTMGNVLPSSNNKDEESGNVAATPSDAIPSSSSDANICPIITESGLEDAISSTSDSVTQYCKSIDEIEESTFKISLDAEADIFANDLNISDVPSEKITEDVEDIVNDLENLLEEGSCNDQQEKDIHFTKQNIPFERHDDNLSKNDDTVKATGSLLLEKEIENVASISNKDETKLPENTSEVEEAISTSNEVENIDPVVKETVENLAINDSCIIDKVAEEQNDAAAENSNITCENVAVLTKDELVSSVIVKEDNTVVSEKETPKEQIYNITGEENISTDITVLPSNKEDQLDTKDKDVIYESTSGNELIAECVEKVEEVITETSNEISENLIEKKNPSITDDAETVLTSKQDIFDVNPMEIVKEINADVEDLCSENVKAIAESTIVMPSTDENQSKIIERNELTTAFVDENIYVTNTMKICEDKQETLDQSPLKNTDIIDSLVESNVSILSNIVEEATTDNQNKEILKLEEVSTSVNTVDIEPVECINLMSQITEDNTAISNNDTLTNMNHELLNIELQTNVANSETEKNNISILATSAFKSDSNVSSSDIAIVSETNASELIRVVELDNVNQGEDVKALIAHADSEISHTSVDDSVEVNAETMENKELVTDESNENVQDCNTFLESENITEKPCTSSIAKPMPTCEAIKIETDSLLQGQPNIQALLEQSSEIANEILEVSEEQPLFVENKILPSIESNLISDITKLDKSGELLQDSDVININDTINVIENTEKPDDMLDESIQQSTSNVSFELSKPNKVVVELSVADTTATDLIVSDNEILSGKQVGKRKKSTLDKVLKTNKPETELNKVLTIEVEDIQSETYETSNDETLECSSRSDLEDGKPEYSSRISKNEDLKMTITKQKSDEYHSILKIYNPDDTKDTIPKFKIKTSHQESEVVPKLSIKALMASDEQGSPKRSFRNTSPKSADTHSPKISSKSNSPNTQKLNRKTELLSPIKLTIKPVKTEDAPQQRCSPKITIKPLTKPEGDIGDASCKGSPKITIKPIIKPDVVEAQNIKQIKTKNKIEEELLTDTIKCNPKITIKPIIKPDEEESTKINLLIKNINKSSEDVKNSPVFTIKPVKSDVDDMESHRVSPKVIIKPVVKLEEESSDKIGLNFSLKSTSKPVTEYTLENSQSSPKITIKPIHKHDECEDTSRNSPKIIIKPVPKPEDEIYESAQCSPKITIKPIKCDDDEYEQSRSSPKITIKPIIKPEEEVEFLYHSPKSSHPSPKFVIKQIVNSDDGIETKQHSPKITIKAISKPSETDLLISPRITIKPILKPDDHKESEYLEDIAAHSSKLTIKPIHKVQESLEVTQSPRITIKPILKPQEEDTDASNILKINRIKKEIPIPDDLNIDFEEQIKQERIVLKIHKNTIPTPTSSRKREFVEDEDKSEKLGKIKLKLSKQDGHAEIVSNKRHFGDTDMDDIKRLKSDDSNDKEYDDDVVEIIQITEHEEIKPQPPPINDVILSPCKEDPLDKIPVFEITPESAAALKKTETLPIVTTPVVPTPRKRGRPRKVPLEVREEFKDENQIAPQPVEESTRPKRSCRGPSVRTTLGIKPRKPRGPGRGRGGKRGMGTGRVGRPPGRPKLSATKLKLLKETVSKTLADLRDGDMRENKSKLSEVVMIEEETRMSAETSASSRAQTPAKQMQVGLAPDIEESQSSVQSTATTESTKARRSGVPRLEVHQEPEGAVISADQLAEYYWGTGGPYMLQEQVAQFLGIKSFKRKYPGIKRRPVEMQERDFIREQSLASEAMCDLGLTAVNSSDILDIMYSDFQYKYEEYCKHQRDRQVKDLSNKQRALSLAVSQEKNNIAQQAVQSAASWNANFNKSRKEDRKACMDLQTFTVHYPKGRMKQINKPKIGNYPLALVPGQFTDYYKTFTPTELNNLPLNTMCYDPIFVSQENEDSQSDCSGSESDTSSSGTDSSSSDSSDEDCNICTPPATPKNIMAH